MSAPVRVLTETGSERPAGRAGPGQGARMIEWEGWHSAPLEAPDGVVLLSLEALVAELAALAPCPWCYDWDRGADCPRCGGTGIDAEMLEDPSLVGSLAVRRDERAPEEGGP